METIKRIEELGFAKCIYDFVFYNYNEYELPEDAEKRLEDVINQLPDKVSKALIMRYKNHMKYNDIANELGCSIGYVSTLINNGLQRIRYSDSMKRILCDKYGYVLNRAEEDFNGLSVRSRNCLQRAGIYSIDSLTRRSKENLLQLRNMGSKSFKEIEGFLHARNLKLSGE